LESGEESAVNRSGLSVFKFLSYISCHSEVRILVDRRRDKTWNSFSVAKNVRERIAKCRDGLHGRECKLADVVRLVKTENTLDLIGCNVFLHFNYVGVQVLNVVDV